MNSKSEQLSRGNNPNIHVEIVQYPNGASSSPAKDHWGSTLFEPQRQQSKLTPNSSDGSNSGSRDAKIPAPEKKITLFALRLAILEKSASGLGTLGFIWATVVLLGGFASTLESKDFWIVTVILLIEGTRIFSRSHEIEWQHQATTWSLASGARYSLRALISSSRHLLRSIKTIFQSFPVFQSASQQSREVSKDVQMGTAESKNQDLQDIINPRTWHSPDVPLLPYAGWVFLSRNFSRIFYWLQLISAAACAALSLVRLVQQDYSKDGTEDSHKNLKAALSIFYGLTLAEALLFLVEKAYWNWKLGYNKLLDKVCQECALGQSGMISIRRFFYDSYSRCIERSIFDGLRMDLVSFAEELLVSDSRDEQLIGARILHKFVTNDQFSSYTLRKIGTSTPVIERLIEILNWKKPVEEEIRRSAADIVSKLAGKKQNAIRVAEIPGAIESISSLLYTGRSYDTRPHEIGQRFVVTDQTDYEFSAFNLLGLVILKKLAHNHDNCWKIGNARGLMPKIIDFTSTSESLLRNDLAMDEEARESIGSTGGVIRLLLSIFFMPWLTENQNSVCAEAGEALTMLAFESRRNCNLILTRPVMVLRLVESLNDPVLQVNAARILRNLCAYSGPECFIHLSVVTAAVPTVLEAIMNEKEKLLEVLLGLASQIFRFTTPEEYNEKLERAGITDTGIANQLVDILRRNIYPEIKFPRMRRFLIELATWMMKSQLKYIEIFNNLQADDEFKSVAETTSELENFNFFSGSVGLGKDYTTISSLVDTALKLME